MSFTTAFSVAVLLALRTKAVTSIPRSADSCAMRRSALPLAATAAIFLVMVASFLLRRLVSALPCPSMT